MLHRNLNRTKALLVAGAATLILAAPADATNTYRVAGTQVVVDQNAGTSKMRGKLLGDWAVTEFKEVATSPRYRGEGVEVFKGCIDRRRDRSCKGDPTGTLHFSFVYEALFASADPASLVWGACLHPIERGEGAFEGARGVIVMSDRATRQGVKTEYVGSVTLAAHRTSRTSRRVARGATVGMAATPQRCGAMG